VHMNNAVGLLLLFFFSFVRSSRNSYGFSRNERTIESFRVREILTRKKKACFYLWNTSSTRVPNTINNDNFKVEINRFPLHCCLFKETHAMLTILFFSISLKPNRDDETRIDSQGSFNVWENIPAGLPHLILL